MDASHIILVRPYPIHLVDIEGAKRSIERVVRIVHFFDVLFQHACSLLRNAPYHTAITETRARGTGIARPSFLLAERARLDCARMGYGRVLARPGGRVRMIRAGEDNLAIPFRVGRTDR